MFKKEYKTKKGYALLEVILSISIICFIMIFQINFFIREMNNYNKDIKNYNNQFYIREALNFIDSKLNENKGQINIKDNFIEIIYCKGEDESIELKDVIKKKNDTLKISYYEKNSYNFWRCKTSNVILRNLKEFYVKEHKGVIYLKLREENGKVWEKYILIKK